MAFDVKKGWHFQLTEKKSTNLFFIVSSTQKCDWHRCDVA